MVLAPIEHKLTVPRTSTKKMNDVAKEHAEALCRASASWAAESTKDWMGIKCEGSAYGYKQPRTKWLPPHRIKAQDSNSTSKWDDSGQEN